MGKIRLIAMFVCAATTGAVAAAPKAPADKAPVKKAAAKKVTVKKVAPAVGKVTVASVSGRAQWFHPNKNDKKWVALKAGDVLDEMSIVRTGFRTMVVLKFADRGSVTINSVSKIGISEFRKEGKTAKTRLGLKYGTLRAKVGNNVGLSDWRVKTPTATLSVRGSEMEGGFSPNGGPIGFSHESPLTLSTRFTSQTVNPGESVTSTPTPPIRRMLRAFVPFMGDSSAGTTRTERQTYRRNSGGRAAAGGPGPSRRGRSNPVPVTKIVRRRSNNNGNGYEYGLSDGE
jgi:hypothetical protein